MPIEVRIDASQHLNESPEGASLPMQLRLLQLARPDAARTESFEDFWSTADSALAEDVLSQTHLTIFPRTRTTHFLERHPEAEFVMAAAQFRQPDGKRWREVLVLPSGGGVCGTRSEDRKPRIILQSEHYDLHALQWAEDAR